MSEFSADRDELASAYLDDDATAEERARVEADPALLARVEEFRAVRDELAAPVIPPTAQRDAAIAAALLAPNVVELDVARSRRRLRIVSIAAAIVLVLGVAGVLIRAAGTQSQDKFQTVAGSVGSTRADGAAAEQAPQAASGPAGSTGFVVSGRPTLGSFADRSSLVTATQAQVHDATVDQKQAASQSAPAVGGTGSATTTTPACVVPAPADAVNEVYTATAVLEGRPVQIDVFTIADGSLSLVVTDTASCAQVFSQPV
ncbi:MAG: hypothetical protein QOH79_2828 [Acidimicrobiaceae bacterium]